MNVRLTKEQKIQILNGQDVYTIMQQVLLRENKIGRNQEHFWVVGLNNDNKVLFAELIGLGAVNRVDANPPDVFRMAIYKLAVKLIMVHNHPSGNLTPSKADKDFTDRMLKVGKLIGIEVIDHLIISEESYTSFATEGIIEELKQSGLYEVVERERKEIQEWKLRMERERAEKEKALEIAQRMKDKGFDSDTIKEITGLRSKDVEGL
ncbi:DNA repair protein [Leptobacterium flavescens]|uniref:DNA repair protein n=1 Tax=Leptobacterium flavescens TaxID=472055 RepID=A0A6P0URA8_9FLAO|nr:JAB domain-containing protein [Leptobacterium flavescens]NER13383.1 DNA repair protein [Leptobacterium flavescens]